MEEKALKENIIKDCKDWLNEQELENNVKNIKTYVSSLYYELVDEIDRDREIFRVPKDLSNTDSIDYIEKQIEKILIEKLNNEERKEIMNDDELNPKIDTKEETLESYNDFKKRYYIYRADDIRAFIQRDGTYLKELYEENDKMYDKIKDSLKESEQKVLGEYADNWIDILNTEIDELTKYILNDFEEER